jgi:hypothetical protein
MKTPLPVAKGCGRVRLNFRKLFSFVSIIDCDHANPLADVNDNLTACHIALKKKMYDREKADKWAAEQADCRVGAGNPYK